MNRRLTAMALCGLAALTAATLPSPARAGEVTVAVSNPGGSRTLYVENLLGQPLTTLNFGTTRSQPFRVRVVDDTMSRSGFEVLTTMSNLYKESGASYDWDTKIASADIAVAYPPNPLNLISPKAVVAPVFDMVETISGTLCTAIQTAGGSCDIVLEGLEGVRQTVDLVVNLADLNSLPLIPQIGETGAYDAADYAGIAASDPNKPGTFTPTDRQVISGAVSNLVNMLNSVSAALQSVVAGQPVTDLVDTATITASLRDAIGGTAYDALLPADVQNIIAALNATVRAVTTADIVGQSGTYLSYPKLDVTVPVDSTPGNYKGTLVVTAVQL
jgi:hypothetical protein